MDLLTMRQASDVLVSSWSDKGFELKLIDTQANERSYEVCLHKGSNDIALSAFFRIQIKKPGQGYFEFGLQLSWPAVEAIRNSLRPPRQKTAKPTMATPAIATLSVVRSPETFNRTTPIVFDALSKGDAEQIFGENRDAYLLRAVPDCISLCSAKGLCAELQRDDWQSTLFLPPWVVPIVFAVGGDESALHAWEQSDANRDPGNADLLTFLHSAVRARRVRENRADS